MDTTIPVINITSTYDNEEVPSNPLADRFLGVGKAKAHDLAEQLNLVFRLVSVNGELFLGYPTDGVRSDRVCVEIINGSIVKASIQ
jgi:hypothetical protein